MSQLYRKRLVVGLYAFALSCGASSKAAPETPAHPSSNAPQAAGAPANSGLAQRLPSLAELVESVKGSVVNVQVTSQVRPSGMPFSDEEGGGAEDFWDFFFGKGAPGKGKAREQFRQGIGSGFVISQEGIILTNNHVVQGATSIQVTLEDGRSFDAHVLGRDPLTDVAVIKIKDNPGNLNAVKLGNSDSMRPGDWVVAIGNPFGLTSSVSAGIISARARNIGAGPYDDFLQTDAAINPGNSGGPLFNLKGEVVGINTAIVGGGTGIGFAVPSNLVQAILGQLEKHGKVVRGYLGVAVQDLSPELAKALGVPVPKGALVSEVTKDSPGAAAGIRPEDVIVAIDNEPIATAGALTRKVGFKSPGNPVNLTLYRHGKKMDLHAKLGTRPDLEGTGAQETDESNSDAARQQKIGLVLQDVDRRAAAERNLPQGALIVQVIPGSPADHAELRPGMVITEASGKAVHSAAELSQVLKQVKAGTPVLLRVQTGQGKALRALTVPK